MVRRVVSLSILTFCSKKFVFSGLKSSLRMMTLFGLLCIAASNPLFLKNETTSDFHKYISHMRSMATASFSYTGGVQYFDVPQGITSVTIDMYGARGGMADGCTAGQGGRVFGTISVSSGAKLYIYIGGTGADVGVAGAGGYNGGGKPGGDFGTGGGGASDIRTSTALSSRIAVAGGGGGCYPVCDGIGGHGGNPGMGGPVLVGLCAGYFGGGGGTMNSGGAGADNPDGRGGAGSSGTGGSGHTFGAGGGGGYYGGGGGAWSGGGGGSSYCSTGGANFATGGSNSHGSLTITYTFSPTRAPTRVPTRTPTMTPTRTPTRVPTMIPTVKPSVKPTVGPTVKPTVIPTVVPSVVPTVKPTVIPTMIPTVRPTVIPTQRPTFKPTSHPSSAPTGQPSHQPTGQPTSQPTGQPTSQPSGQPTSQPSRQPSGQPTAQPSASPSRQPSSQPSRQPSGQPTVSPSRQPSAQPSASPTSQPTQQPSAQPTAQPSTHPSGQPSSQPTVSPTSQPTGQPSRQPSSRPSGQPTAQPSASPSMQPTGSPNSQPTAQPSVQPSASPSMQPTASPSTQPTGSPSTQPSSQPSVSPSCQPTAHPSGQPTGQPSAQPSSQPSGSPSVQPSGSPTAQPSGSPTQQPSSQPSGQPTSQPSANPSVQPTASPTRQPSAQPTAQPSQQPSAQPSGSPTSQPSICPSSQPTCQPSVSPSSQPTAQPSGQPTQQPSGRPSARPSSQPSSQPSVGPTFQPTSAPSGQPTSAPSRRPTAQPSSQPSSRPSVQPSGQPSGQPTSQPSGSPTAQPSGQPTAQPSVQPSSQPSRHPTRTPTLQPSAQPSASPSYQPSSQPSGQPTDQPTNQPTAQPSGQPSVCPSGQPSAQPSGQPTSQPSTSPSSLPTEQPSTQPSSQPSGTPTSRPTGQPFSQPSAEPTGQPSSQPTAQPSGAPSAQPSSQPTDQPSAAPSGQPSTQPTAQPSASPSAEPSGQPSVQPSAQPTSLPSGQPSSQPSTQPTAVPSGQPSSQPSAQPSACPSAEPSGQPSGQPSVQPTAQPSSQPSSQPSVQPSTVPSRQPSSQPSAQPSVCPTSQPSGQPTMQPSSRPTALPSGQPTSVPSHQPSAQPSTCPTVQPSSTPTSSPSAQPSCAPSRQPSGQPTGQPSVLPSAQPSGQPSAQPTSEPSGQPSGLPSSQPSVQPTASPSAQPSGQPSSQPSSAPTGEPSSQPSAQPTGVPSAQPSGEPSSQPSRRPSGMPSAQPSKQPSGQPSSQPTSEPSAQPTNAPSGCPSSQPSSRPSQQPSAVPSSLPSMQPTSSPTGQPTFQPSVQPSSNPTFEGETRHPTICPTSSVPTGQPSGQPSGEPTGQPTVQPSSQPSSQPSAAPSSLPTGQPSVGPSMQPSAVPSAVPSQQPLAAPSSSPSSQPSHSPSGQPSGAPSMQPSAQPSGVPSGQPSAQPTSEPSQQPSSQPTQQPVGRPSSAPSQQPFGRPSSVPSSQPSGRPSGAPSNQPSAEPSAQPSVLPSGQPSSEPSSQPSEQPFARPSSAPSSQPSAWPSSQPTTQPSNTPSLQPTGRPSQQPTTQPTSSPSAQPSAVPSTSVPTSSAPLIQGMQRTHKPTPRPSVYPTSQPTGQPTSMPSITVETEWTEKLSEALVGAAADDATLSVSARASYYEMTVNNQSLFGSCNGWRSFQRGELALNSQLLRPVSIAMTVVVPASGLSDSRASETQVVTCSDSHSVALIVGRLAAGGAGTESFSQQCGNHTWVVRSCDASVKAAAVCVDCVDPCATESLCPAKGAVASGLTIAPCQEQDCSSNGSAVQSDIRVLSVGFSEWQSAPDVTVLSVVTSRTSATVSTEVSDTAGGLLYCAAYPAASHGAPQSAREVIAQGHGGIVTAPNRTVVINGLSPATSYDVYCASQAESGALMTLSKVLATSTAGTTDCCKSISMSLARSSVLADDNALNLVTVSLEAPPTEDVTLSLYAVDLTANTSLSLFVPSSVAVSRTHQSSEVLSFSLRGTPAAQYQLSLHVSGPSANEFSVAYHNGNVLTVAPGEAPPPDAPVMLSAVFASDGSHIMVDFDSPTDKAGLGSGPFDCSLLFGTSAENSAKCQWTSGSTVRMMTNQIVTGDSVVLRPGKIRVECQSLSTTSRCASYVTNTESTVVVAAPLAAVAPSVSLAGPTVIGSCDSLTLDLSASTGSGGRAWAGVTFSVFAASGNATAIQAFLAAEYRMSPPTAIPQALLEKGVTYNFVATLCNFLAQCGQSSLRVSVLSNIAPRVGFPGPPSRTMHRHQSLTLVPAVYVTTCDGTRSTEGLDYAWSVKANGVETFGLVSQFEDWSKFLLLSYSLAVGVTYEIKRTATLRSSSLSSSATVSVTVVPSPLIAAVAGGSERAILLSKGLTLDASASSDPDVAPGVYSALQYSWMCVQTAPVLSESCGVDITSPTLLSPILSLFASADRAIVDAISQVTVTVRDAASGRSAKYSVAVTVAMGTAPQLTLSSNVVAAKMNPSSKLTLSAAVQLAEPMSGTAAWSVDDTSLQLASAALMPLSVDISSSTNIFLSLSANSLPPGSSFVFHLSCAMANGQTSRAAISVVVNSPPALGSLTVSPTEGVEMRDVFVLAASHWIDEDVPLSYQFGIESATGSVMVLQTRSELAYMSSALPAGSSAANGALNCVVRVFDVLGANSSALSSVTVHPLPRDNGTYVASVVSDYLRAAEQSVDGFQLGTASVVSGALNYVNCTFAPNCSALNRHSCAATPNTCGACVSDAFVGDAGDSNSACIAVEAYALARNASIVLNCSTDSHCASQPWHSCVNGLCIPTSKSCATGCSTHGVCSYQHSESGAEVDVCTVGDASCTAVCHCDSEWYGPSCSEDQSAHTLTSQLRTAVISSLGGLLQAEDASVESIGDWTDVLVGATRAPHQLMEEGLTAAESVTRSILDSAQALGADYSAVSGVLDTLNSMFTVHSSAVTARRRKRRMLGAVELQQESLFFEQQLNITSHFLQQFSGIVANGMRAGQQPVSATMSQFRMTTHAFTPSEGGNATVATPLTASEIATGKIAPSVSFPIDPQSGSSLLKVSSVLINAALYANPDLNSSPLQIHFNSDLPCAASDGSHIATCIVEVDVVLQNNAAVDVSDQQPEPYLALCRFDDFSVYVYECADGFRMAAACNGTVELLSSVCPYTQPHSVCNSLMGSDAVDSGCVAVAYTATNTTCRCPIRGPASGSSGTRRRLQSGVDDAEASTAVASSGGSANFVSMLAFLAVDFKTTILSADSLTAASVKSGWKVLATLGALGMSVLMFGLFAHKMDATAKKVKPSDKQVEKVGGVSRQALHKKDHKDGSSKRLSSRDLKRALSQKMQSFCATKEMGEIEQTLPNVLRSKPFSERFLEEVKHFHKWLGIVFYYSDNFPRVLRIISLSTSVMAMLFVQSITYNLTNPDDGTCELYTRKTACLAEMSPFGTGDTKCYWTPGKRIGSCHFNQPAHNLKIILFVAIFAALISTPIALAADWVVMNVLAAKTRKLTKQNKTKANEVRSEPSLAATSAPHSNALPFRRRMGAVDRNIGGAAVVVGDGANAGGNDVALVNGGRRRFSIAAFLQLDTTHSLNTTLQQDLSALLRSLCSYREELASNQRQEFSELWGLDNNGQFVQDNQSDNSMWKPRNWLRQASSDGSKVQTAITNDLRDVRTRLESEIERMKERGKTDKERGQRMLFLFQRDLLPGVNGKILESKGSRDALDNKVVDASSKLLGWIFIVVLNVGMLFYVYLFALQQTEIRQSAWFQSFAIWLVTEVFFVSTAVVFFTHFVIPSIIMKDVGKIKQRLLDSIRDYNAQVKAEEEREAQESKVGSDTALASKKPTFNAAAYLFVSYRLAQEFPDLRESKIISRFSTPWPPQSYHHVRDVSKSYSKKFSALTRSISMVLIFLIGSLIQIPPGLQDMVVSMCSTGLIGYTALVHIQLFQIFPVLVIVPAILIAVVVHFILKASSAKAQESLNRPAPVGAKAASNTSAQDASGKKKFVGDVGYQRPQFANDGTQVAQNAPAVDGGNEEVIRGASPVGASKTGLHRSRRASLQQGRALLQEITVGDRPLSELKGVEPIFEFGSSSSDRSTADDAEMPTWAVDHGRHRFDSSELHVSDTSDSDDDSSDDDDDGSDDEKRRTESADLELESWVRSKYLNGAQDAPTAKHHHQQLLHQSVVEEEMKDRSSQECDTRSSISSILMASDWESKLKTGSKAAQPQHRHSNSAHCLVEMDVSSSGGCSRPRDTGPVAPLHEPVAAAAAAAAMTSGPKVSGGFNSGGSGSGFIRRVRSSDSLSSSSSPVVATRKQYESSRGIDVSSSNIISNEFNIGNGGVNSSSPSDLQQRRQALLQSFQARLGNNKQQQQPHSSQSQK